MYNILHRVSLDVWTTGNVRAWIHKATMPAIRLIGDDDGDDNDPILLLFFIMPADVMRYTL
jgi:hypothetical protein